MFYNNRNTLMYTLIGAVISTIIDEYICHDSMDLLQEKLSKHNYNFKKKNFNDLSGLGLPEILMNIMSCHVLVKSSIPTVILTYRNALVPYYLSKLFVVIEIEVGGVDNIPIILKNKSMLLIYMKRIVL